MKGSCWSDCLDVPWVKVGRGILGPMLTFWKAVGVPQWTVLVMSVVPSLWARKINIYSSAEYLGVGIVAVCCLCAFQGGSSGRSGVGVRWVRGNERTQMLSSSSHLQHLCIKGL